jgi:hypothetical protein
MPEWNRSTGNREHDPRRHGRVVNGQGESKVASIGLSLPGTGEDAVSMLTYII